MTRTEMTKAEALSYFDGSPVKLAKALGYKARNTVHKWPDEGPIPKAAALALKYEIIPALEREQAQRCSHCNR